MDSSFVGFGDSEFFSICEYNVHVFVEGKEGADHHTSILNGDPDSEVDPL